MGGVSRTDSRTADGVGLVEDRHNAQLADLFQEAWGGPSTEHEVARWRAAEARDNPVEPGREPPKWIFSKGGKALGYLGTMPARFMVSGHEFGAYWLKGLWVRPEYRDGPVGFAIVQQAMTDLGPAASSVVGRPARRLLEAHGLRSRGSLFNKILVLQPGRFLEQLNLEALALSGIQPALRAGVSILQKTRTTALAGAALYSATSIATFLRGRSPRAHKITTGWSGVTEDALDRAWAAFKGTVRAATVRDGALLRWRYARDERYEICAAWDGDELKAWSVLRRPAEQIDNRLKGLSVASLSDVLFPVNEPDLGLSVVAAAERLASTMGADAILCSGTHPALADVLARRGFVSIPANLHFLARDWQGDVFADPIGDWWLTRGDAASDGAF